jgi:hypothetical protein
MFLCSQIILTICILSIALCSGGFSYCDVSGMLTSVLSLLHNLAHLLTLFAAIATCNGASNLFALAFGDFDLRDFFAEFE